MCAPSKSATVTSYIQERMRDGDRSGPCCVVVDVEPDWSRIAAVAQRSIKDNDSVIFEKEPPFAESKLKSSSRSQRFRQAAYQHETFNEQTGIGETKHGLPLGCLNIKLIRLDDLEGDPQASDAQTSPLLSRYRSLRTSPAACAQQFSPSRGDTLSEREERTFKVEESSCCCLTIVLVATTAPQRRSVLWIAISSDAWSRM